MEKLVESHAGEDMSLYTIPIHNLAHDARMKSLVQKIDQMR